MPGRFALTCFALLFSLLVSPSAFAESPPVQTPTGVRDFAAYWAASRLLWNGANPYSPAELFALQKSIGWTGDEPLVMWNPPWTLALTLPFAAFNFSIGQFLWLILHTFFVLYSAQQLWFIYKQKATLYCIPWILALTFVPICFALIFGQINPLVLLGVVGFMIFERSKAWFAAGAITVLVAVKPHLLYLFWIALILWIWQQRRWRVAFGAIVVGLVTAVIPAIINSSVYLQFFAVYQSRELSTPLDSPSPSLGRLLSLVIGLADPGVQFIPSLVGAVWIIFYWHRHKNHWEWRERMPLILLASLTTSAYGWSYDQVVLLPAIIQGASWARNRTTPWYKLGGVYLYLSINLLHGVMRVFIADDIWYAWLAPAMLIAYLVLRSEAAEASDGISRGATKDNPRRDQET